MPHLPLDQLGKHFIFKSQKLGSIAEKIGAIDRKKIEKFAELRLFFFGGRQIELVGMNSIKLTDFHPMDHSRLKVPQVMIAKIKSAAILAI